MANPDVYSVLGVTERMDRYISRDSKNDLNKDCLMQIKSYRKYNVDYKSHWYERFPSIILHDHNCSEKRIQRLNQYI